MTESQKKNRRTGLIALSVVVLAGAIGFGAWWLTVGRYHESTEDAYVSADVVQVTAEVPGTVIAANVDDTQNVQRNQILVELDPADARVSTANAEANLARAVRQVRSVFAVSSQLRAQIAEREAALARAEQDLARRTSVSGDAVSKEDISHAQDAVTEARAALVAAREQLNATTAQVDGTTVATHPQVLSAAAQVREASLALHRTRITAPVNGVVARRNVQVGQRVAAGTPLMAVVPLEDVWVDANFKEVQLKDMRVGQKVELHSDLYGDGTTYHGTLAGLSAGSGSAFALLPAQNASGNWIKVVQRVPVRIVLDPKELKDHPLRVGLSMSVSVDIKDKSGSLISGPGRDQSARARASIGDDAGVEQRIAQIIQENSGVVHLARR